ncbi:hypothetical protein CVT26_011045 [Gymnopilus dilepis]|uniref:DUF4218 domain-containing protein n=1 Tax=Gymnopilus dilepis TaxID=231916 RepID=A0A409WSR0_9AGAR|nr:hypothetical protein CVT26_011045 [Gymnopilus dilepis]
MPRCFCLSHGCSGESLTQRLYAKHQREDKTRRVDEALLRAERACQGQDDAISDYIGSLTLSDGVTGGVEDAAAGRIWCRSEGRHQPAVNPSLADGPLDILCQIEHDLSALLAATRPQMAHLNGPSSAEHLFPLKAAMSQARGIQDRLAAVHKLNASHTRWTEGLKMFAMKSNTSLTYENDRHHHRILPGVHAIVQACIFTMVAFQVILHTSRRGCHFLLEMMRYIIQLTIMRSGALLSAHDAALLADIPMDPASVLRKFHLESVETVYAVCPNAKCHKTYAPKFSGKSPIPVYPKHCEHRRYRNVAACGTRLTRPRSFGQKVVEVPIKRFVSFSFKDYVGNLVSRPGYEDLLDDHCGKSLDLMSDIGDGDFLRDFKGPDGTTFGSTSEEGRYAFSLCVDFFNPFSNRQAGQKYSVGIVSVACLNLPPSLRYKPENMFLAGIIPGPNEPPTDTINHYLCPLVDDLVDFWDPGIWYTKTHDHPDGRLIRCALALVVCDLPAARKTAGYAAASHEHFCSLCHCTRSHHGYGNIETDTWVRRTNKECRMDAEAYHQAADEGIMLDQFNKTGIRWSELTRLLYFDMVRCVVIDSMHNLFLGLVKEHFTAILGIGKKAPAEKPVLAVTFKLIPGSYSDKAAKGIETIRTWLEEPVAVRFPCRDLGLKRLMRFNLEALTFVCRELGCLPSQAKPTKEHFAGRILDWRYQQNEIYDAGADSATKLGSVISVKELTKIRNNVGQISTPSWVASVPANLGSAAHGKLKADQWRALGTIHLPLALISMWFGDVSIEDSVRARRCRSILDVTMELVSAVIVGTSRSVTRRNANQYHHHMVRYLSGVKQLFPSYRLHPNHHLALHLDEFLLRFGPVHGWWTFPFERMIGAVQRMPHNGKAGVLETTIGNSYTRSANLRALILKPGCPEVIRHSKAIFGKLIGSFSGNLPSTGMPSAEDEDDGPDADGLNQDCYLDLSDDLCQAFRKSHIDCPSQGRYIPSLSFMGVTYSTSSKHHGNSCVLIARANQKIVPAQIEHIVKVLRGDTFAVYLAVRPFKPMPPGFHRDPFMAYPCLQAELWDAELGDAEIILPSQVACHFACLPTTINQKQMAVCLSLSRNFLIEGQAAGAVQDQAPYMDL